MQCKPEVREWELEERCTPGNLITMLGYTLPTAIAPLTVQFEDAQVAYTFQPGGPYAANEYSGMVLDNQNSNFNSLQVWMQTRAPGIPLPTYGDRSANGYVSPESQWLPQYNAVCGFDQTITQNTEPDALVMGWQEQGGLNRSGTVTLGLPGSPTVGQVTVSAASCFHAAVGTTYVGAAWCLNGHTEDTYGVQLFYYGYNSDNQWHGVGNANDFQVAPFSYHYNLQQRTLPDGNAVDANGNYLLCYIASDLGTGGYAAVSSANFTVHKG